MYLCIYWVSWVLVAAHGLFVTVLRTLFSCGSGSRTQAQSLQHVALIACGILVPCPGTEPMSPALEGGFLTTGPPGKSLYGILDGIKWDKVCEFPSTVAGI